MITKINLRLNDIVEIYGTESFLDGMTGVNLGTSSVGVVDLYIILLDVPLKTHRAVTIPESCLKVKYHAV